MTDEREAILDEVSNAVGNRPTRWAALVPGDYEGRERTLEIFEADATEQLALMRCLRPIRESLQVVANGPVVIVFHTRAESQRLHAAFIQAWRAGHPSPRQRTGS